MKKVVIAGAGIAGLSAAEALVSHGIEPLLLEASPAPGGVIRTSHTAGYVCEDGPASFVDRSGHLLDLARRTGLLEKLLPALPAAARRLVVAAGALHPAPDSPLRFLLSRALSLRGKVRIASELLRPRGPSAAGKEESVADFALRRFGPEGADRLLYPLVSALYACDPQTISVLAAVPCLADLERTHRSVLLGALREDSTAALLQLKTFQGGMRELPDALAARLGPFSSYRAIVSAVARRGERFAVTFQKDGASHELLADAVILAMPAPQARDVIGSLDAEMAAILGSIPYVPVALVHLGYRREQLPRPLDSYGFFVPPSERMRVLGGVFASAIFPRAAPDGHVLISVRTGGARNPELAGESDERLVDLAHATVSPLLGIQGGPAFSRIGRQGQALAQYTLGHTERIAALDRMAARYPGLHFTGSGYKGASVPDCIKNARAVAALVGTHT